MPINILIKGILYPPKKRKEKEKLLEKFFFGEKEKRNEKNVIGSLSSQCQEEEKET